MKCNFKKISKCCCMELKWSAVESVNFTHTYCAVFKQFVLDICRYILARYVYWMQTEVSFYRNISLSAAISPWKVCTISIAWLFHSTLPRKNKISRLVINHLSYIDVSSNTCTEFINLVKFNIRILKENTKFLLMTCRCDIYRWGDDMTVFLYTDFHNLAQANW